MSFADQMATDLSGVFLSANDFGELVTYTTPGGTATSNVKAVFAEWLGAIDEKTQAVLNIPLATIASPERGAKITRADGSIWRVIDVSQQDSAAAALRIVQHQATV